MAECNQSHFRFSMMAGLGLSLLFLGGYSNASQAASDWTIQETRSTDAAPAFCTLRKNLSEAGNLVLARDVNGAISAAVTGVQNTVLAERVTLSVDTIYNHSLPVTNGVQSALFYIGKDADFIRSFKAGHTLNIRGGDLDVSVNLKGSTQAVKNLNACISRVNGGQSMALDDAPPPLSQRETERLQSVWAERARASGAGLGRGDLMASGRPTYVHVHLPRLKHSAQIAGAQAGAGLTPQKPTNETWSQKTCTREDTPHAGYLDNVLNNGFYNKISLLSGSDDVISQGLDEVYTWASVGVTGQLQTAVGPIAPIKSEMLKRLPAACPGDFAFREVGMTPKKGLQRERLSLACFHVDGQTLGEVTFISDGMKTSVLSLEAPSANAKKLNEISDELSAI